MNKKRFSISVNEELYKKLDEYKWTNRMSLNSIVTEALEKFLESKE